MNPAIKTRPVDQGLNPGVRIKRLTLRVDVETSNLGQEVKRVFDMAKSSGLELDLMFSQDRVRTA
jgi:uncharacterized protein (UPF0335 family)